MKCHNFPCPLKRKHVWYVFVEQHTSINAFWGERNIIKSKFCGLTPPHFSFKGNSKRAVTGENYTSIHPFVFFISARRPHEDIHSMFFNCVYLLMTEPKRCKWISIKQQECSLGEEHSPNAAVLLPAWTVLTLLHMVQTHFMLAMTKCYWILFLMLVRLQIKSYYEKKIKKSC